MTEKERIEGEIKILQKKLALIEELEKTKSPVEEAFKRVYSYYPEGCEKSVWFAFQNGYNSAKEEEPEDTEWKSVALRFGEELSDVGPCGYYQFTAEEWFDWVVNTYEKICDDTVKLLKKEKVKKSKINDLAEKLLPDDHPYKIADEHGELNPYKQGLNMIKKDKEKMEELGFVKNSDGSWTVRPLGETAQERGERIHKEMEETIKIHDGYGVVDVKTNLKPQTPEQVSDGLKEAFREAIKQGVVSSTKQKTLYDVIADWWNEVFTNEMDDGSCINVLVSRIEAWLPAEHDTNSYKWNQCIRTIKEKLR